MSTPSKLASVGAPSMVGRAAVATLLLVGFYAVMLGIALVLLAIPVKLATVGGLGLRSIRLLLFMFALCWIPALLLITSVFAIKPRSFAPPGHRLTEAEAPELFRMVADLARAAETAAPEEIYLTADPTLSVTEDSGLFGKKGPRILVIGAPVLAWATVEELRAGLAHEFGHFAFGDTGLLRLVSYTHAAFRSVLENTERRAFADTGIGAVEAGFAVAKAIGNALVQTYAKFFFWVTRRSDRRAELTADRLAAHLVGAGPLLRLLEKLNVAGPLYEIYIEHEVGSAMKAGGLPTDLAAGFARFSSRMTEHGITGEIEEMFRSRKTDAFDTHPAFAERAAALAHMPSSVPSATAPPAATVIAFDLEAWTLEALVFNRSATLDMRPLVRAPWAELGGLVFAPRLAKQARDLAAHLFTLHPEARDLRTMFASVVAAIDAGHFDALVHHVEPELASAPQHLRAEAARSVGRGVLTTLFSGVLLEEGAVIDISLGDPSLSLQWKGTKVSPHELARQAFEKPDGWAALRQWATSLAASTPTAQSSVVFSPAPRAQSAAAH